MLIYSLSVAADGFIADREGAFGWTAPSDPPGTRGWRTGRMRKLIVWNVMTLDGYFEGPTAWDLDMHGTVWGDELEAFSLEDGKDVFIFGSAELVGALLAAGLVDEYRVCLAPVVLGTGNPLFKPGSPRRDLDLLESRPLKTGGVLLRYGVR